MSPTIQQLSVFIENKAGRIAEVTSAVGEAGINIRGFSVSDTEGFGILRLVVDKPDEARQVLKDAGFTVRSDAVICIDLPDHPGGLASVLRVVSDAGVNIEYVYSLVATYVVIDVAEVDGALDLLEGEPVRLVGQEEIGSVHLQG